MSPVEIPTMDPTETLTLEESAPGVYGLTLWHKMDDPGAVDHGAVTRIGAVRLDVRELVQLGEQILAQLDDQLDQIFAQNENRRYPPGRSTNPLYAYLAGERFGSVHGCRDETRRGSAGDLGRMSYAEQIRAMAARYEPGAALLCGKDFTPLGLTHGTEKCAREPLHGGRCLSAAQYPTPDPEVYPDDTPVFAYGGPVAHACAEADACRMDPRCANLINCELVDDTEPEHPDSVYPGEADPVGGASEDQAAADHDGDPDAQLARGELAIADVLDADDKEGVCRS